MFTRINKQFLLVAATLGVILGVFSAPAMAEQCSADGKICLVTDTSQPLHPSAPLRFKVTSEAAQVIIPQAASGGLVEQGPPGGMSVWEVTLSPISGDQLVHVEVDARGPNEFWVRASFDVSVLGAATGQTLQIRRTKKRITAIFWFEARTTLTAQAGIALNSFKGGTQILKELKTPLREVGPGNHEIRIVLPRHIINRKCGTKTAPNCSVIAYGRLFSGGNEIHPTTFLRQKVKPQKKRKTKNLQRRSSFRNSD